MLPAGELISRSVEKILESEPSLATEMPVSDLEEGVSALEEGSSAPEPDSAAPEEGSTPPPDGSPFAARTSASRDLISGESKVSSHMRAHRRDFRTGFDDDLGSNKLSTGSVPRLSETGTATTLENPWLSLLQDRKRLAAYLIAISIVVGVAVWALSGSGEENPNTECIYYLSAQIMFSE